MHLNRAAAAPSLARAFANSMASLGPFEAEPTLAVAVSGGPDSLALALLASAWSTRRGGRIVALTVDHRLRPESADEARRVGRWLKASGIGHRILVWEGPRPRTRIQASARQARYDLLTDYCRKRGLLHLLLGHQEDDQAETAMMRQESGSGPDGLAGMAALVERNGVRLLRPLLDVPRARLVAFLDGMGQPFVDDPSNRDARYLRPRLRKAMGPDRCDKAVARVRRQGLERARREAGIARLMAGSVRLEPAGYARIERAPLVKAPDEAVLGLLGAVIVTVGGGVYRPASMALQRVLAWLRAGCPGGARTLGGCRLLPVQEAIQVYREAAAMAAALPLTAPAPPRWDGRFVAWSGDDPPAALTLRALRGGDLRTIRRGDRGVAAIVDRVSAPARPGLPVLEGLDGFLTVPQLTYEGFGMRQDGGVVGWRVAFRPTRPLADAPFQPSHLAGGVARTGFPGV